MSKIVDNWCIYTRVTINLFVSICRILSALIRFLSTGTGFSVFQFGFLSTGTGIPADYRISGSPFGLAIPFFVYLFQNHFKCVCEKTDVDFVDRRRMILFFHNCRNIKKVPKPFQIYVCKNGRRIRRFTRFFHQIRSESSNPTQISNICVRKWT